MATSSSLSMQQTTARIETLCLLFKDTVIREIKLSIMALPQQQEHAPVGSSWRGLDEHRSLCRIESSMVSKPGQGQSV